MEIRPVAAPAPSRVGFGATRIQRAPTALEKKARRGFRGYPVATVAFYGPDASRASKVAVGVVTRPEGGAEVLERWFSDSVDVRFDDGIDSAILAFIRQHSVMSVALADGIIGCPHEEGVDYPEGEVCPACPYWADRDRWTSERLPRS